MKKSDLQTTNYRKQPKYYQFPVRVPCWITRLTIATFKGTDIFQFIMFATRHKWIAKIYHIFRYFDIYVRIRWDLSAGREKRWNLYSRGSGDLAAEMHAPDASSIYR